jgi:hypothetical protein
MGVIVLGELCAKPVLAPSNNKNVQVQLIASVITTS